MKVTHIGRIESTSALFLRSRLPSSALRVCAKSRYAGQSSLELPTLKEIWEGDEVDQQIGCKLRSQNGTEMSSCCIQSCQMSVDLRRLWAEWGGSAKSKNDVSMYD